MSKEVVFLGEAVAVEIRMDWLRDWGKRKAIWGLKLYLEREYL